MKIYLITLFLFLGACADKGTNVNSNDKSLSVVDIPLSDKTSVVLDALKQRYTTVSRSALDNEPFKTFADIENCNLSESPYYDFNVEMFYSDPSPRKILESLSMVEDKFWIIGERADGSSFRLIAIKQDTIWRMESMTLNWKKVVSWLPEKLKMANANEYKVFDVYAQSYFLYYKGDEPVYCDLKGKEYNPEKMCENLVEYINYSKEYQKKLNR